LDRPEDIKRRSPERIHRPDVELTDGVRGDLIGERSKKPLKKKTIKYIEKLGCGGGGNENSTTTISENQKRLVTK